MTTAESVIKLENSLKDNNVNTRASRQESILYDEELRSRIESSSDPFRNFANNAQILGNPEYEDPLVAVENIGVLNTKDAVAPLLEKQTKEQLITVTEESEIAEPQEETNKDICTDECTCKVIRALYLIVDELKKVDSVINKVNGRDMCVYTPTVEDKKVFIDSIKENSYVCHVIINELKRQRIQINDMLKLYNESTVKFSRLEAATNQQSDKVLEMEVAIARVLESVEILEKEAAERHVLFVKEKVERKVKDEKDEELHQIDLAWLSTLEERRKKQLKEEEERDKNQELKRIRDRAMLTAAIRQLQELTIAQRTRGIHRENLMTFRNNPANEFNCKNRRHFHCSNYNKSTIPVPARTIPYCHCSVMSPPGLMKFSTADPTAIPIVYGSPVKMSKMHFNKTRKDEYPTFRQGAVEDQMQSNRTYVAEHRIQNDWQQKKLQLCHMTNGPMNLCTNTQLKAEPTEALRKSDEESVKRMQDALVKKEKHFGGIKTINANQRNIGKIRPWFGHYKKNNV